MARPKGPKFEECVTACKRKNTVRTPNKCRNPWAVCTEQAKKERRTRNKGYSGWWRNN